MSVTATFDTSAWLEYFMGSSRGSRVKEVIDSTEAINTPSICLLEIKSKYVREGREPAQRIDFVCSRSRIIDLTKDVALSAADFMAKHKLHTVDAVIYAAARKHSSKLLTGDKHFSGLEGVELI
ncbi:MAG: type II toxin-antitoxin system VapC family toxin [Candidatus Micrarchaeia archaeon]